MVKASLNSRKSASQKWRYDRLFAILIILSSIVEFEYKSTKFAWLIGLLPILEHCFELFISYISRFLGRDFCLCLPSRRRKAKLRLIWNKHKPLYCYIVGHWYMALCRVQFYLSGRIYENINLFALMSSYLLFLTFVYFCCIIPFIHVCVIIPVLVKPFQFVVNLLSFWRDMDFKTSHWSLTLLIDICAAHAVLKATVCSKGSQRLNHYRKS